MSLATALLALMPLVIGHTPNDDDVIPPGPPAGVSGIAGFLAVSSIEFDGLVGEPHRLEVVYLFPDRARWSLRALNGQPADRTLFYRFGNQAWAVDPGKATSRELERPDRLSMLLQVELRRAVMFFPLGFDWTADDESKTRSVTIRETANAKSPAIGRLVAEVDSERRARRITAVRPSGEEFESLEVLEWQTIGKRDWPRKLRLSQGEETIWDETVESVVTRVSSVDRFFQPVDRRAGSRTTLVEGKVVQVVDLSPITYRAHPIDSDADWESCLESARTWIDDARDSIDIDGTGIDPVPSFELDANGRPTRCLVRLSKALSDPPPGWTTRTDLPGVALVVDELRDLGVETIALLRRAAPPGERAGTAYCRVLSAGGPLGVQVYLPLQTGD